MFRHRLLTEGTQTFNNYIIFGIDAVNTKGRYQTRYLSSSHPRNIIT